MSGLKIFVPIRKVDEEKRLVYGIAASEVVDKVGEIMDYATAKPEFQKWSDEINRASGGKSRGNLRAMHGKIAAGKVQELSFDDAGKSVMVAGKVVDDNEWNKVLEGVYTGFSIGGAYAKRWEDGEHTRYTPTLSEISLVDNPCMPGANFEVVRANGAIEMRKFTSVEEPAEDYVPTNAEVSAHAEMMAKEDGNGRPWGSFVDAARLELIKAKGKKKKDDPEDGAKADAKDTNEGDISEKESDRGGDGKEVKDKKGKKVEQDKAASDEFEKAKGKSGGEEGKKGPSGGAEDDTEQDDGVAGEADRTGDNEDAADQLSEDNKDQPHGKGKSKSRVPTDKAIGSPTFDSGVEQVWLAKDGTHFKKKAEAIAHNAAQEAAEIVKEAVGPVQDVIDQLHARAGIEKREFSSDQRKKMASEGTAMKDGSYPIANTSDLHNAVQAYGRAKDKAKTKRHIIARAKALNSTGMLPAGWTGSTKKADDPMTLTKGLTQVAQLCQILCSLDWLCEDCEWERDGEGDGSDMPETIKGAVATLAQALRDMVDEETSEMFDEDKEGEAGMSESLKAIGLSGISAIRKAVAHNVAVSRVFADLSEPIRAAELEKITNADVTDSVTKADHEAGLAKVRGDMEQQKAAFDTTLADIRKQLQVLLDQPAPHPLTRVVSKMQDGGGIDVDDDTMKKAKAILADPQALQLAMIKLSQTNPISITDRGR